MDLGYRHFDGARFYGNEKWIGESFNKIFKQGKYSRKDIFITTKFMPIKTVSFIDTLKVALADLGFDYVDLYLIHFPVSLLDIGTGYKFPLESKPIHKAWAEMEECVKLGLAKSIGISNFNCQMILDLLTYANIPPAVN